MHMLRKRTTQKLYILQNKWETVTIAYTIGLGWKYFLICLLPIILFLEMNNIVKKCPPLIGRGLFLRRQRIWWWLQQTYKSHKMRMLSSCKVKVCWGFTNKQGAYSHINDYKRVWILSMLFIPLNAVLIKWNLKKSIDNGSLQAAYF